MFNLPAQGLVTIGYLIFFISRFRKNKKSILMTDNISRICFIVGYFLFNSINSVEHTIYGMARNIIGQALITSKRFYKILGFLIMLIILCIIYSLSFNGVSTIMFMLSGLINLFAIVFATEQGIRLGTVIAAICNIIAFLIIGSHASVVGELLCGIAGILSFIKENKICLDGEHDYGKKE